MPRVETKCCIRRWWLSWGDGQVPPVLCCVVLYLSHCRSCAVEFLLCESGERAGPPHLDSWTPSLCDPSQMIAPAAASQSSFNIELMLSVLLKETFDMTHQLSGGSNLWPVRYVSVCSATAKQHCPASEDTNVSEVRQIKYQIIRNVKGIKTLAMWVEIPAVIAKSWSFKVCGPSSFSVHLISARQ